jgi:deoxycytidylate deaminase
MRSDKEYIDILLKMVRDSPRTEWSHRARHASAVVYRGQVVAFGFNSMKSHPFAARFCKNPHALYLHAETAAIYNSLRRISLNELCKSTLYVARLKQSSSLDTSLVAADSRPCIGCTNAIATFNIKRVVCTGPDGMIMDYLAQHELQA